MKSASRRNTGPQGYPGRLAGLRLPPEGAGYDEGVATEATTTEEDIYEALEEVIDPELGLDFVSLGLVYDVEIEGDEAYITFTLTTPACPIGPQVSEQMREFVGDLQGINKVHPKMIFDPPWSPEMMSEDAKFALGY
jgi:metal-sulfur cluster biosynthetic enzyme